MLRKHCVSQLTVRLRLVASYRYFQFFFYTMGESQMGRFGFASWTLHMSSIIIFSSPVTAGISGNSSSALRVACNTENIGGFHHDHDT